MTPSLEGWPTTTKEAPSPDEVRLTPLDSNPVFQFLGISLVNVTELLLDIDFFNEFKEKKLNLLQFA